MTIPDMITAWRKKKRLSLRRAGELLGIGYSNLRHIEQGKHCLTVATATALAPHLKTKWDVLAKQSHLERAASKRSGKAQR